jgi:hypothetical protein
VGGLERVRDWESDGLDLYIVRGEEVAVLLQFEKCKITVERRYGVLVPNYTA